MDTFNSTQSARVLQLPQPEVKGLLDDVPGGETNLLPQALTHKDLKVWFTIPSLSNPTLGEEKVELYIDDDPKPFDERTWNAPIAETDRYIEILQQWLRNNDGEHRLRYRFTIYNGEHDDSLDLVITLDTRAPDLATDSKLIFPPQVLPPNELTAYYLEDEDKVRADILAYTTPRVGDVITWYWDRSPSGTTIGGTRELTAADYDQPLFIDIEGDWIRSQGDGDRYAWYSVTDRAGNPPNGQSAVERLIVKAQPVPRVLPPPKVVEAVSAGWPANGTLNPVNATNGVNVVLNPESVVYPDEVPQVQWGEEGTLGYYLADPVSPGAWEYKIPKGYMAPHFGKVISVKYLFTDKHGKPHESAPFTLTVSLFPKDRLSAPQCAEGAPLSLALVPPEGASITMTTWPFIAAGQQVMIRVEGQEDSSGNYINHVVYDRHVVTSAQAAAGIVKGEALVTMDFLARIRLGTSLVVKGYVSFDNGQTWNGGAMPNWNIQHFPWLQLRLNS